MQALIIIDMQETPMSQDDKYDRIAVMDRINKMASSVRENSGKVIFIQHDGSKEEGLEPDSPGWEICKNLLLDNSDHIFRKTTNSAFYRTGLLQYLRDNEINQLVFCGWATDYCVDSSIKAAISLEFDIIIAGDCHTVSDRAQISAPQLVSYFNHLWADMICPNTPIKVITAAEITDAIRH